jgi:hypothetical protein
VNELHLKGTAHPPFSPDIAPSEFFLSGWLKSKLALGPIAEIDELFEIVEVILVALAFETIASVLSSWIERLKQFLRPTVTPSNTDSKKCKRITFVKSFLG